MNEISKPQIDLKPLINVIMGAEMFRILATGIKYEIFNLCEEPKTAFVKALTVLILRSEPTYEGLKLY